MKKIVAVALTFVLAMTSLSTSMLAQTPTTGELTGTATSNTGRRLSGLTVQLRSTTGTVLGSAVTKNDGSFSFPGLNAGSYTLECLGTKGEVIGTARATLAPPSTSQSILCASDVVAWPIFNKKVLAALGAAAVALGAVAVVSTRPDGSPAR